MKELNIDITIKHKLVFITMFTTLAALFAACLVFIIADYYQHRKTMANELLTLAQVVGNRSSAAILFNEESIIEDTLEVLKAKESITNACIYSPTGDIYASFRRKDASPENFPSMFSQFPGYAFTSSRVSVFYHILNDSNSEIIGSVYINSDLREIRQRVEQFVWIVFITGLFSSTIAFLLAFHLQKIIVIPVMRLLKTVNSVAEQKNYSARTIKSGNDEIGQLTTAFNKMLDQLQTRDKALHNQVIFQQNLIDSIPVPVLFKDKDFLFIGCNKAAEEFLGLAKEKIIGRSSSEVFPKDFAEKNFVMAATLQKGRRKIEEESTIVFPDGRRFDVVCHKAQIRGQDDQMLGLVGTIFDITVRKRAEEEAELRRSQLIKKEKLASLGTLVAGVAHEINNPNNFIMVNTTTLQEIWENLLAFLDHYYKTHEDFSIGYIPYSTARESIPRLVSGIVDGSERINNIVQTLKKYAKKDTSGMDQNVDINAAVEYSIEMTRNIVNKSTSNLAVNLSSDLPTFKGNAQRIEQVIINLIINSCESLLAQDKAISISTSLAPGHESIILEVADEGAGIPKEVLSHIMDPFFTTKRDTGGTGLGLSISQGIINNHGGSLHLKSTESMGSTAIIKIPVTNKEEINK
jgi:PAS domain S-box-containing protein